jgi:acetoin utilization deacetylase AcuC-like enzyme
MVDIASSTMPRRRLNTFALAAASRVSILDVDYHHGNGTQDIFYDRNDVQFLSIHADPASDYPYFLGYADETGSGQGEGFNFNYPLPHGSEWSKWSAALDEACCCVWVNSAPTHS